MKINEIDIVEASAIDPKYKKGSYKLDGGLTGKGGQIGDIIDMVKRHYGAWKKIIDKNQDIAKSDPDGLLKAWIERFYGSSSAKISLKKATTEFGVETNKKGANAILRIVIAILLKPKSSVEMQSYLEQVADKLPSPINKEVAEKMPAGDKDVNPSAAQNQVPDQPAKSFKAGDKVTWTSAKGKQITGTVTKDTDVGVKKGNTQVTVPNGTPWALTTSKLELVGK